MKHLYILFLVISVLGFSQEKYLTKSGVLNFEASVDTFEEIKATNDNVTAIFNASFCFQSYNFHFKNLVRSYNKNGFFHKL